MIGDILIGKAGGEFVTFPGEEHVALYAPTRSGKGVSCVIPNLLHWPHSAVVLDVKGENWRTTAGYRSEELGQQCYLFDPLAPDGRTAQWNPLSFVDRTAPDCFNQILRVAQSLFPESTGNSRFWDDAGRFAFAGVACFVAENPTLSLDIATVLRLFTSQSATPYLRQAIALALKEDEPFTRATVESINDYLTGGVELVNSIRKNVTTRLSTWFNPRIAAATSVSSFDIAALRSRPMSIYVKVSPSDIELLRPLLSLLFQQIVMLNTKIEPPEDPTYSHPALIVLDEFATLGCMPVLADAFAFIASYGVRMMVICQSPGQLRSDKLYGEAGSQNILDNCGIEIVFGTKNSKLAEDLSARAGYNTVDAVTQNRPRFGGALSWSKQSEAIRQHKRAMMLPQEILRMDRAREMVFRAGMAPALVDKIRWFDDPVLQRRYVPAPFVEPIEIVVPMDDGGLVGAE